MDHDRSGPSVGMVQKVLLTTALILGVTVFAHVIRYGLLLINRSVLLNPLLAGAVTWLGLALSVVAVFAVVASAIVLTNWLIARRSSAYAMGGVPDPRSALEIRAGCLIPLFNLLWAPVFVFELAGVESRVSRLRRSIVAWWCVWVASTVLMVWSVATSFTRDAQGIADNTVTSIIAYLAGLAALVLVGRVFLGFERNPVDRPAHRWVMVADDPAGGVEAEAAEYEDPAADESRESAVPVGSKQREPAA